MQRHCSRTAAAVTAQCSALHKLSESVSLSESDSGIEPGAERRRERRAHCSVARCHQVRCRHRRVPDTTGTDNFGFVRNSAEKPVTTESSHSTVTPALIRTMIGPENQAQIGSPSF